MTKPNPTPPPGLRPENPATPIPAATVILLREEPGRRFEVLLQRRHLKQTFQAGAFVFPGGRVDAGDADPALLPLAAGFSPDAARAALKRPDLSDAEILAPFIAAVRETFEEAGLLLAYGPNQEPPGSLPEDLLGRLPEHRRRILQHETTLAEIAAQERITFAMDRLTPYANWITPEIEPKRFNAVFLLARAPRGAAPIHDSAEMTETVWLEPAEALARNEQRNLLLMPPTLKSLYELNKFPTMAEAIQAAQNQDIRPILPEPYLENECIHLRLPHDPDYNITQYKKPECKVEPSRLCRHRDGSWELLPPLG